MVKATRAVKPQLLLCAVLWLSMVGPSPASGGLAASGAAPSHPAVLVMGLAVVVLLVLLLTRLGRSHRRERAMQQLLDARSAELAEARAALAEANRRLEDLVVKDELTDLYNRRHFERLLDSEWRRAIRSGRPVALIALEVDDFAQLVATYSRQVGDECLTKVATAIVVAHRAGDLLAYLGGATFGAVLPETDLVGALLLAERMRTRVANLGIRNAASSVNRYVTVSAGVATTAPALGSSSAELLAAATHALAAAKAQGRNRVVPASVAPAHDTRDGSSE